MYKANELLNALDPRVLNYEDWLRVGMALHHEGEPLALWEEWSARDPARFKDGECARKWAGFGASSEPTTLGSVVKMARDMGVLSDSHGRGGDAHREPPVRALAWDDVIWRDGERPIIDIDWLEDESVPAPADDWNGDEDARRYLTALFKPTEHVGYVTEVYPDRGGWAPSKGVWVRTQRELLSVLARHPNDLGATFGDYKPDAGAWIRFNPLDGRGVRDENVTEYRYALVECDELPIERQLAIIKRLELPVRILVHSGRKSLHAIVKIDAGDDLAEYKRRVNFVYETCAKNGLTIDKQNRNPSRLSRFPGFLRNGARQYIVAENMGFKSYAEWAEHIEEMNDALGDPECVADKLGALPPLAAPLIDGVLRQGHKLLLAGPSKAGKSFALIQLCVAIAEGRAWMGFPCARGRVLYVNLELDAASCFNRIHDVYAALGATPAHARDFDVWNLRGRAMPMDKLAPKLIRRAQSRDYIAIVIDPIYKVITGDENSAAEMSLFCNQFDRVCNELGCAVIYCHHHSKGTQGQKRSMDRASGSGVFARDPDAMLDMLQLELSDETREQEAMRRARDVAAAWLDSRFPAWRDAATDDEPATLFGVKAAAQRVMSRERYRELAELTDAWLDAARERTAWRIEGTLREFKAFAPVNAWFEYPIHTGDESGALKDAKADGDADADWRGGKRRGSARGAQEDKGDAREKEYAAKKASFVYAVENCNYGKAPTLKQLMDATGMPDSTARRYANQCGYFVERQTGRVRKRAPGGGGQTEQG